MKDFRKFLELLDENTILEIAKDANEKVLNTLEDTNNVTKNAIIAMTMFIEVLGLYHKWLFEETETN